MDESKEWYLVRRPVFQSGFENDEFGTYGDDGFEELLTSFIASDVQVYDKRIYAEPKTVRAIVQNATSDTLTSSYTRQILTRRGTLHCGQYIKSKGGYWLVSSLPDDNGIYEKAILWKCRHSLSFISPTTGEIVTYPVYSENSTQYGTGEQQKTNIAVGDDQHLIYLPYNEETIPLNDGFRFIMDKNREAPSVYRITRVDPVSFAVGDEIWHDGLIQWAVIETQFNEAADSKELMVADYYTHKAEEDTGVNGKTISIEDADGDRKIAVGDTKEMLVSINDLPLGRPSPGYDVKITPEDGGVSVREKKWDRFILEAEDEALNIGKRYEVTVTRPDTGAGATVEIQVVNW